MRSTWILAGSLKGCLLAVAAVSFVMMAVIFSFLGKVSGAAYSNFNYVHQESNLNLGDIDLGGVVPSNHTDSLQEKRDVPEVPPAKREAPLHCFPHNSKVWLTGNRLSNVQHDHHPGYEQILGDPLDHTLPLILSQTICDSESAFRNPLWTSADRESMIEGWKTRLLYMALHYHHHAPAIDEAKARQKCAHAPDIRDFECPSAKFLVTNLEPIGLGASFRTAAVNSMLLGLAKGRITIFLKQYSNGTRGINFEPWLLASCPRHDMQCVYRPTTPCTITEEELRNAPVLPEMDARDLRRMGKYRNPLYESARIIVVKPKLVPSSKWPTQDLIESKMLELAGKVVDLMRETATPEKLAILEEALTRIANGTITPTPEGEYEYSSRYHKTHHAALLYLMRPNDYHQRLSNDMVKAFVPRDYDTSLSIGLPIRGSDKCSLETVCYGFDKYMKLAKLLWKDALKSPDQLASLVLTTEDTRIMSAREEYEGSESFPFRFIVNTNDTLQGNGNPGHFGNQADHVMLSSLVSLKLQLRTKFVVGNCCSNFHLVLFDFLHEGCGTVARVKPMCLQEHQDPEYFLCCKWTRTEFCNDQRAKRKQERIDGFRANAIAKEENVTSEEKAKQYREKKERFKQQRRQKRLSHQHDG